MAKKQKSFADKAAGSKDKKVIYVKYVKSVKSEKTGQWRFNEQMVRSKKGEQLDVALKRLDEVANLVDIDLSQFAIADTPEVPVEDAVVESNETVDETIAAVVDEQPDSQENDVENLDASNEKSMDEPVAEESSTSLSWVSVCSSATAATVSSTVSLDSTAASSTATSGVSAFANCERSISTKFATSSIRLSATSSCSPFLERTICSLNRHCPVFSDFTLFTYLT
jgi:hypothetical protein